MAFDLLILALLSLIAGAVLVGARAQTLRAQLDVERRACARLRAHGREVERQLAVAVEMREDAERERAEMQDWARGLKSEADALREALDSAQRRAAVKVDAAGYASSWKSRERERARAQAQERDKTSCRHPMPLVDENQIAGTYDCRACGARFPLAAGCPCEYCAGKNAPGVYSHEPPALITYEPPRVITTCEEAHPRAHELRSLPAGDLAQAIHKALRASPGLWASLLAGESWDRDDRGDHAS